MTARPVDCDMHLFEPVGMWRQYCDPGERDVALRMEPDDLGYVWLVAGEGGRRVWLAEPHQPKRPSTIGDYRQRQKAGLPSGVDYESFAAPYSDPAAILRHLDTTGFGQAVLFPNYGIIWERPLDADLRMTHANMGAWNRWIADVRADGAGRLHPVAHVNLRDRDWLLAQLAALSAAGIRLALIPPALVDGRRLSDPTLDWAWAAFGDHGITPVFHVADHLQFLDGGYAFAASFNGEKVPLSLRPSDYFRRQVRVAAFSYEQPRQLIDSAGDIFMACRDFPHTEGTDTALDDYARAGMEPARAPAFFAGNVDYLLRAT